MIKKKKDFDSLKRVQLLWPRNVWQIGQLSLFSRVKANCLAFEFIIHHFRSYKLVKTSIWVLQFHLKRTRVTEKSILSCVHSYMFIALHLALPQVSNDVYTNKNFLFLYIWSLVSFSLFELICAFFCGFHGVDFCFTLLVYKLAFIHSGLGEWKRQRSLQIGRWQI